MHFTMQTDEWIAIQGRCSGAYTEVPNLPFAHSRYHQVTGDHRRTKITVS